ncbi:MAG: thioredoxin family protein [Planctomycetota bacterium]|nr:thioredoxin family protein [Planctomycetota bacterium]
MTIARATAEKKRILLQVGGEWCGWCKLLTGFIEKSEPIRSSLEKNFLLMKVTYTQKQPNEAFLSKYPKIVGYPHLFVLDSDGTLLHSQDTTPLEKDGNTYNEGKILSFLQEWKKTD